MLAVVTHSNTSIVVAWIESVVRYWTDASAEDLARMGVDRSKVPTAEVYRRTYTDWLASPKDLTTSFPTAWLVDGKSVGFSTLKDIRPEQDGSLHLHVWAKEMRGKGYGAPLFCLTALSLYERFRLRIIRCEPKVDNPYPNGMLRKVGFPLERTYVGASSELSIVCELASYRIERPIAEAYLARYPRTPDGGIVA